MSGSLPPASALPRWLAYVLIFGLFLTLRGYHSRDGDQAYRLPLLLHYQEPSLYAADPFVRAFDAFNPHRGYVLLLDASSRPFGLSAGMAVLFALTFAVTCWGLDRLARAVWPEAGPRVGLAAVGLVLIAKAGNIGTNHLFEAMLLDRLIGFGLGWVALALAVEDPARGWRTAPAALGVAALVHPSIGLQLALVLGTAWIAWALVPSRTGVGTRVAVRGLIALVLAIAPGLAMNLGQGKSLFHGLPLEEFRLLSVELQGPQHMLPHLWRPPQWLAWGCFAILAAVALTNAHRVSRILGAPDDAAEHATTARMRLAVLMTTTLAGLGVAWLGVEVMHDLRLTLFQPFRMATVFRGLALVALSGRLLALWTRRAPGDRARVVLVAVGLAGDWSLVVATLVDLTAEALERVPVGPSVRRLVVAAALAWGLVFLSRHDTESGHLPLILALGVLPAATWLLRGRAPGWNRRRIAWAVVATWVVPAASLVAAASPVRDQSWARALLDRTRFAETPVDDIERLAVWCRGNTPPEAQFIGPPGPKTFRLWSRRSLAFNRASSPYDAAGLADWSTRFRDHVGFRGSASEFVRAYVADRHGLERKYQSMGNADRAALAIRQGATHVIAAAPDPRAREDRGSPLEVLHIEGRYAVYRVRTADQRVAHREPR